MRIWRIRRRRTPQDRDTIARRSTSCSQPVLSVTKPIAMSVVGPKRTPDRGRHAPLDQTDVASAPSRCGFARSPDGWASAPKNRVRAETNLSRNLNPIGAVQYYGKKKINFAFAEIKVDCAHTAS